MKTFRQFISEIGATVYIKPCDWQVVAFDKDEDKAAEFADELKKRGKDVKVEPGQPKRFTSFKGNFKG